MRAEMRHEGRPVLRRFGLALVLLALLVGPTALTVASPWFARWVNPLLTGWMTFPLWNVGLVTLVPAAILFGGLTLGLLSVAAHAFLSGLLRAASGPAASRWWWRWTAMLVLAFMLAFVTGLAAAGLVASIRRVAAIIRIDAAGAQPTIRALEVVSYKLDCIARSAGGLPPHPTPVPLALVLADAPPECGSVAYLVTTDAWGRALLYRADADGYRVWSRGQDGRTDPPRRGAITDPAQDLVLANGRFLTHPDP